jgi:hypothetical protein
LFSIDTENHHIIISSYHHINHNNLKISQIIYNIILIPLDIMIVAKKPLTAAAD